ncbi:hypothetical protein [Thalassomonas sp. M1454]|uniref:hypothetical protein n=1 Tax=Thalassomonas sp. M1454 TaxID=2594477 RepID=UPI00117C8BF5|nr:hypothetical protein [Thalassomonas sp. M1454]TRX56994.1 hypothetical protein FNN08_05655 [Thalassomonas sp. M1454]
MKKIALLLSSLLLVSCSGDDPDSDEIQAGNIILNESELTAGLSTQLILSVQTGSILSPVWTQVSGPDVELLSAKSKVVGFTIPSAGDYSFEVNYTLSGSSVTDTISFTADSGNPNLVARLGHSVIEGNGVSLRAFYDDSINPDSITWQQISGPSIRLDEGNITAEIAIFDAPEVARDSIVEMQVSAQTTSGAQVTDTVSVLVENAAIIPSNAYFDDDVLATVYPYVADSPHKDNLQNCVYSNQLASSCTFNQLPIIASDSNGATPTIDQIMDHVLVSHDWMGQRFREYLEAFDDHDDFKNLFRATTAIVLSYDIRPSFYWAATGAIYLDPNTLWLTPEERDTINEAPDYRANFGNELQFVMPWRYVKDNDYVSFNYPTNERITRSLNDLKYDLADLLYHELAHANDYLPSPEWQRYTGSSRFLDAALNESEISDRLTVLYPLQSTIMKNLASVRFLGEDPTLIQKSYTPSDVAGFYSPDISNGFYNYTNEKEDLGILFESLMMSVRFGVQRDTAVTTKCDSSDNCYIVSWGQRGRVAEPGISERAEFVAENILPEFDTSLINSLPAPIAMQPGLDWWDNLAISPAAPKALSNKVRVGKVRETFLENHSHSRALPKH